jgi:hypothetical protein
VAFKTAQIYDYENGSDLIPTIDKYSRYKRNEDGTGIQSRMNCSAIAGRCGIVV